MEKRKLGSQGDPVSVIGFGAWPIGGGMGTVDERQAIATVHAAIDHGITLIDTAQAYRSSEELIGKALAGGRRNDVFLATKASFELTAGGIRTALEKSLQMLGTDRVDLYQLHRWEPGVPIEESMGELAHLKEEGKIRFIGVSNFSVEQTAHASSVVRVDSTQPPYNMFDRAIEAELLPYCQSEGIGVLAHSIFAKGLLTGKYSPGHQFAPDDERSTMPRFRGKSFEESLSKAARLREVADELGVSLIELSIAWILRNPAMTSALAGAKSPEQVAGQVKGAELRLDAPTLERIDSILA